MSLFLGLIGMLGAAASLVLIVIRAIKKKPKKPVVIALLASIVLFFIGAALPADSQADTSTTAQTPEVTEAPAAIEAPTATEPLSFILMDGEKGEYGVEVVLNEGTEFEEHEITYKIPAGTYTVENLGDKGAVQISVFCGGPEKNGEWEEFVKDDNCANPIVVMAGESKDLEIKESQFVVFSDDSSNIQFIKK